MFGAGSCADTGRRAAPRTTRRCRCRRRPSAAGRVARRAMPLRPGRQDPPAGALPRLSFGRRVLDDERERHRIGVEEPRDRARREPRHELERLCLGHRSLGRHEPLVRHAEALERLLDDDAPSSPRTANTAQATPPASSSTSSPSAASKTPRSTRYRPPWRSRAVRPSQRSQPERSTPVPPFDLPRPRNAVEVVVEAHANPLSGKRSSISWRFR